LSGIAKTTLFITLALLFFVMPAAAAVDAPYESYQYTAEGKSISAPVGYTPKRSVSGTEIGIGSFGMAADIFRDQDNLLYVSDSQKGVLHVLDQHLNYIKTITFKEKGREANLAGLAGIYIHDNRAERQYYLCDPERERVAIADEKGTVFAEILSPGEAHMPPGSQFKPSRVLVNKAGNVYVLVPNVYRGALVFSQDGAFITFYGANDVELTARLLLDYVWKGLLSRVQRNAMARYVPVSFSGFDIDREDFIYTATEKTVYGGSQIGKNQLKKLNGKGINIFKETTYGDLEMAYHDGRLIQTAFVDVDVMDSGHIAALDATQGRVFIYDQESNLLTVFGGIGSFVGNFTVPVALETVGEAVFVLDQMADTITKFVPTTYGQLVMTASLMYQSGRYEESLEMWNRVLKYNGSNLIAYKSIGKAYMAGNDFENARKYFKLGNDRSLYSDAFKQQRALWMRKAFPPLFALLVLGVGWVVISDIRKRTYVKREINPVRLPMSGKVRYTLFHPTEGFEALVRGQDAKRLGLLAGICLAAWFLGSIVQRQLSGFIFNQFSGTLFSIWPIFGKTVLIFGLFVLSNWFVSTMMEGSGRLIDITAVTAVGLIPYIVSLFVETAMSNIVSLDEKTYLTLLTAVMLLWTAVLLFAGLKAVHQMTFKQTVALLLFTGIGILLILFLALLLWSLFQQLAVFLTALFEEVSIMIKTGGTA
jgi:hypothetical protein